MKRLLIIAFIAIFAAGCSKDETETPDISIVGTWTVQSNKAEYYTAGDVKDYEEDYTSDSDGLKTIVFTESNATLTAKNNTVENSGYEIIKDNDKHYLQFTSGAISDDELIEINLQSATTLLLIAETYNEQYQKAGVLKTAAKVQVKVILTKQ
jgi:hypothetical protein